jgi:hypothetical protein
MFNNPTFVLSFTCALTAALFVLPTAIFVRKGYRMGGLASALFGAAMVVVPVVIGVSVGAFVAIGFVWVVCMFAAVYLPNIREETEDIEYTELNHRLAILHRRAPTTVSLHPPRQERLRMQAKLPPATELLPMSNYTSSQQ